MSKSRIVKSERFIDIRPTKAGGLTDLAFSTIEILEENDVSAMELVDMLESDKCSRQELLDRIIYELEQLSMSEIMDAPIAPIFPM